MPQPIPKSFALVIAIWLLLALVMGWLQWVSALRPPTPQLVLLSLTAGILLAGRAVRESLVSRLMLMDPPCEPLA